MQLKYTISNILAKYKIINNLKNMIKFSLYFIDNKNKD